MGKKRKGKAVRKNKSRNAGEEDTEVVHAPHSFVIQRGKTGKYVQVSTSIIFLCFSSLVQYL